MKNLLIYWLLLLLPIPFIVWLFSTDAHGNLPVFLLITYFLIYKPLLDASRLVKLGVITPAQWWKVYIPGSQIDWFYQLYFKA